LTPRFITVLSFHFIYGQESLIISKLFLSIIESKQLYIVFSAKVVIAQTFRELYIACK